MKLPLLSLSVALASCWSVVTLAETIVVDDQVMVRESAVERPARGLTMSAVEAHFGAPVNRSAAVGAPPITRWDYAGFVVFFENERVIDAVAIAP